MKTNYRKIDVFLDNEYRFSTTWYKTLKSVKQDLLSRNDRDYSKLKIECKFADSY